MFRFKRYIMHGHRGKLTNFNTSYVSVQAVAPLLAPFLFAISIHHMFRFKLYSPVVLILWSSISIHHMFRFKCAEFVTKLLNSDISIHHMFRFKNATTSPNPFLTIISIHHMFRFKLRYCKPLSSPLLHFNTSYVSVQVQ